MKILLFDGFSIMNRAFYALPPLTNSAGDYTNAIYGFLNIFFKFVEEEKPDYITVAWDLPAPTFRHGLFGAYKGTRKGMPDELRAQVAPLKTLLEKMEIPQAATEGFEADDILGTLAIKAESQGITPVIITGDRDLLQLATDTIKIRLPRTKAGKTEVEDYNAAAVREKYGVTPTEYISVKALMGDTSDNIPGVPGIGEVTAKKIIAAYSTLEAALENLSEIKPKKAAENLAEFKDQAFLSRDLATIRTDIPIDLTLAAQNIFNPAALEEIKRLEIKSYYKKFESNTTLSPESPETPPVKTIPTEITRTAAQAQAIFQTLATTTEPTACHFLWDTDLLIGMAIALPTVTHYFHIGGELTLSLDSAPSDLTQQTLLTLATPYLQSQTQKAVYDIKTETRRLQNTTPNFTFDTMLAAYVLDALQKNESPSDIAESYLAQTAPTLQELLDNKGKRTADRKTPKDLPESTAAAHTAQYAQILLQAQPLMQAQLTQNNQNPLLYEIEQPLATLLAEIETTGIKLNKSTLTAYGATLDKTIESLTAQIHAHAATPFNINSPQQLGEILFTTLGLKGGKKTTKGYSTAAEVLEKLKHAHPIIPLILEYRAHTKLKSTYVEGMLPLISLKTGRIHTTFQQALTATGRLSSTEPNLQNIPIRTPLGRELRKAFIADDGMVFLDADYSQIELRLLAHISGDPTLINAFNNNEDIHRLTAAQVLGIPLEEVTPDQRNNAKAVNFGIIYGISAFGLSTDLGIPVNTAEKYINGYFAKYPGVKQYLNHTIKEAKQNGYVSTLYNRRRNMAELRSANYNTRQFGERVAMNMPIQGAAADIIKIAMLKVAARLRAENLTTRIVLQVHDELILEAPIAEQQKAAKILKEEMENAANLAVPLTAEVKTGETWYDTK